MNMSSKFPFFFILIFPFLLNSCDADIDIHNITGNMSIHPEFIVPLGSANVTLGEMLTNYFPNGKIQLGPDNVEIYYVTEDSVEYDYKRLNFLENAHELSQSYYPAPNGVALIPPGGNLPVLQSNETLSLGVNSDVVDRIDSVKVTSATMNLMLSVSSDLKNMDPSHFRVKLSFPKNQVRYQNGSPVSLYLSPLAFNQPVSMQLSDFIINTSDNLSGIPVLITIESTAGVLPLELTPNSAITCKLSFSEFNYSVAYGYFRPDQSTTFYLQRNMNLQKKLPDGVLKIVNPQMKIFVSSNIGSYLKFYINYIRAFDVDKMNDADYAWFDNHTTNSTTAEIDIKPKVPGLCVSKQLRTLDKDWGETNQLFEDSIIPGMLEYKFSTSIDSEKAKADPTPGFITSDARIKVKIHTTFPFYLNSGSYYTFNDTITNIFKQVASTIDKFPPNSIDSLSLVLSVKNGLPVKANLKIMLIDSVGNELHTDIIKDYTLYAGTVDDNGVVQPGKEKNQIIIIKGSLSQLGVLRQAHGIAYRVVLDGQDLKSKIHIKATSTFELKAGFLVNTRIEPYSWK